MLKKRCGLLGACLLVLASTVSMAAEKSTQPLGSETVSLSSVVQASYDHAIELATQKAKIDGLEKQIEFVNNRFEDVSIYLAGLGILLTFLAIGASFASYFAVRAKTREQAQEAAKEWFSDKAANLERQLETFKEKLTVIETHASQLAEEHKKVMSREVADTKKMAAQAKAKLQEFLSPIVPSTHQKEHISPESIDTIALEQTAILLKDKSPQDYKFEDWQTLAYAAYAEDRKIDAARYWQNSLAAPDAMAEDNAKALFNTAAILTQLNRFKEAEEFLDELNRQFVLSPNRQIRQFVLHGGMLRGEIFALQQLEEEAAKSLAEFIAKQEPLKDNVHQAQLLWLKNAAGFYFLLAAKKTSGISSQRYELLRFAYPYFVSAAQSSEKQLQSIALGNQAYCNFLMGGSQELTESLLNEGLALGGEKLYQAEIQDMNTYPISEDASFKKILDLIWASVNRKPEV